MTRTSTFGSIRKDRGYAMVTVTVCLTVLLTLLGIVQRHLSTALHLQRHRQRVEERDSGRVAALGRAIQLLETGLPPSNPYSAAMTVASSVGTVDYEVTYTLSGANTWRVHVAPATGALSPLPASFAD